MMAPLRGASWVPPGLARLLAVALQGTILPWMATLVLPEGGLLPALPVQPVLFPPPTHHQVATLATLQDWLLSPPGGQGQLYYPARTVDHGPE